MTWDINKVVAEDTAGGRERCTRRFVKGVKKNVKFPSSPEETVRSTVRNVSQSAKKAVAKRDSFCFTAKPYVSKILAQGFVFFVEEHIDLQALRAV